MLEFPPDVTALYQIAIFLVLWFVLKRLVFDRFLANLSERHRRTRGALAEARRLREEAGRLHAEHEALMAQVRREALRAKEEIHRQAEKEERELLEGAREEAARTLAEVRARVARETVEAKAALERQTDEITDRVVRAVLGKAS